MPGWKRKVDGGEAGEVPSPSIEASTPQDGIKQRGWPKYRWSEQAAQQFS